MTKVQGYTGIYEYYSKKLGGVVYYASIRDADHKAKKVKLEATSPKDAMFELEEIKKDIRERKDAVTPKAKYTNSNKITYAQLLDKYTAQRLDEGQDPKQTKENVIRLKKRCKSILKLPLNHILPANIRKIKEDMIKNNYAPATINSTMAMIRATFNTEGITIDNPAKSKGIGGVVPNDKEVGTVISDEDMKRLFEHITHKPMLHLFTHLLFVTGARPAAIISLQTKHIGNDYVMIKALKKGKSYNQKINTDPVFEHIKRYDIGKDEYLFHVRRYKVIDKTKHITYMSYQKQLTDAFDKLNIDATPYSIRRTSGTRVYKKHGIVQASRFLGHSKLEMTMNYLNVSNDIDNLEDLFKL